MRRRAVLLLVVMAATLAMVASPAWATTFTVNSTADPGTGGCNATECTLREAITAANASSTVDDTIEFDITTGSSTVKTISPTSQLPAITDTVTIDGYTQDGAEPNDAITNANSAVLKIELDGTSAGVSAFGLAVSGAGAAGTTIKGLVINRFGDDGVFVSPDAPNTTIEGNFIGTNAAGTSALGNGSDGVTLLSSGNVIGGPANAAQNIISGNGANGVAVKQSDAAGNTISNNHIGTDKNAEEDLGNSESGVLVEDASDNTLGGNGATGAGNGANGEGNIISGNDQHGVEIIGVDAAGARVLGNFIGLNRNGAGSSDIGNTLDGVLVSSTPRVEIGGMEEGQGNTISDNDQNGVEIVGFSATDNEVLGNRIGTNFNGSSAFGNAGAGVRVVGPSDTTIGGTDADDGAVDGAVDARNVISDNRQNGVFISGGSNATNNRVEGNRIGTDANGTSDLGNGGSGVRVEAPGSFVGGTAPGTGNLISGNGFGVLINGSNSTGNAVQGNLIGTNANGTGNLGNSRGVFIAGAPDNTIGGTDSAAANTISGNTNQGVFIGSCTCATGNRILGNSILDNGRLGIELGLVEDGPTPNDKKDPDTGPNNLQNFPIITSASTTTIKGTLNSRPRRNFIIQFFSSPTADPSSFGEGKVFLGEKTVRTNEKGKASFTFTPTAALSAGEVVTATATRNSTGDTSEFSAARQVQ